MGATARKRPRPVPALSVAVLTGTDPSRNFAALQRTTNQIAQATAKAVSHPTLRDQVVDTSFVTGSNTVTHGLGRVPRFVYVTLAHSSVPTGWSWTWVRGSGDADSKTVSIVAATNNTTVPVLVRLE